VVILGEVAIEVVLVGCGGAWQIGHIRHGRDANTEQEYRYNRYKLVVQDRAALAANENLLARSSSTTVWLCEFCIN